MVQESHCVKKNIKIWETEWTGLIKASYGETNARGVMLMISPQFSKKCKIIKTCRDIAGHWIVCEVKIEDTIFTLINVYGPNEERVDFWTDLIEQTRIFDCVNIVMGGDFNCVLDEKLDSINRGTSHPKTRMVINDLIEEFNLIDVWRMCNPLTKTYTWQKFIYKNGKKTFVGSRLDYFLISGGLVYNIKNTDIQYGYKTDHSMISMELQMSDFVRGPGIWKLNTSILTEKEYLQNIEQLIVATKKKFQHLTGVIFWEILKERIIQMSKEYTKKKARKQDDCKHKVKELLNKINRALIETESQVLFDAKKEVEKLIESIIEEETRKHVFLSKCKWAREGELPTSYFLSLAKRNYLSCNIKKVINDSGVEIGDQSGILNEQRKFYKNLYSTNNEVEFTYVNVNPPRVDVMQCIMLDLDISENELYENLILMKPGKVPGLDGLPKEFYQTFFHSLKKPLMSLYDEVLKMGVLNPSARKGLITLLPKKSKNLNFLKSWRPLTLLCMDYKLLAKVFAECMKLVLDDVISPEQTGFRAGKDICENLRRSLETIDYCNRTQTAGVLISIDFEKCFDCVEHSSVLAAMRYYGFPEKFTNWVSIFFRDFVLVVQNYGNLSPPFCKERGVNQGCPISPFCYLVLGELIAEKIKMNQNIQGIDLGTEIRNILSQFADDTALFLKFDKISIEETITTFQNIEANTGLKVSYEKTVIYWLGSIKNSNAEFYTQKPLMWSNEDFVNLGVTMSNCANNTKNNYEEVINKMSDICNLWRHRPLTLMGKVLVINSLMESLFVYN